MTSEIQNIPSQVAVSKKGDLIKLEFNGMRTDWISADDYFIERLEPHNLNRYFPSEHLTREFEVKNILDEGRDLFEAQKYKRAIDEFDRVIYYDDNYTEALILKSHALFSQGHYVKALRFYKRANSEDSEYYRLLLEESSKERQAFPKIKSNIYAGDEAAFAGDYKTAIEFYDRALENPSKFKNKILFKLLNKKARCLVKMERFDEALASFDVSIRVHENDSAYFGKGYCQYRMGLDCLDSLKHAKIIDKRYLLIKANILNELGQYGDALESFDEFLNNHFTIDLDFKSAIEGKAAALDCLGLDSSDLKAVLEDMKIQ